MGPRRERLIQTAWENLSLAEKATTALRFSLGRIEGRIPLPDPFDPAMDQEFTERLEALAGRFARLADLLLQKVFRSIDILELETQGSLIDSLDRMEKHRLIDSSERWQEIRDLRNQISHEYQEKALGPLYNAIHAATGELMTANGRCRAFLAARHPLPVGTPTPSPHQSS